MCTDCAKVRLEDDLALTAFLQKEHATTKSLPGQADQSFMDVSAPEAGGTGGTEGSEAGATGGNKPSVGGEASGGHDLFDESEPMLTDEDEDSFPGLSQGSKVQCGPSGRGPGLG